MGGANSMGGFPRREKFLVWGAFLIVWGVKNFKNGLWGGGFTIRHTGVPKFYSTERRTIP